MNIEKLPSGSFRARKTYNGKVYRITFDHKPTIKELDAAFSKKIHDNPNGSKGSFERYANSYIKSRDNVISPSTIRTYEIKLRQLPEDFRKKDLFDITQEDVQIAINIFSENHAAKTARTLHGFISSVIKEYRPNFALHTKLPQIKKDSSYDPASNDIKAILNEVKGTDYSIPFQLGVLGLRRGEICALELSDLNGCELNISKTLVYNKKWILKETPKTETSNRVIYIPEQLANEIRKKGYIYNNHPNALNKAIHRVQKKLGIKEFKFHSLRSYFASYAHTLGIPDKDIMAMGGWKSDEVMKKIYRKAMQESVKKSMSLLSEKMFS